MMSEIDSGNRDRDENKPEVLPLNKYNRNGLPLNNSHSLSSSRTSFGDSLSSCSKSHTPDHVVPSETNGSSPHRLSTSSGSSSPQTDGSISYRRTGNNLGTDASRSSSVACSGADSSPELSPQNCRTLSQQSPTTGLPRQKRTATTRKKPQRGKRKGGRKPTMLTCIKKEDGLDKDEDEESEGDYVIRCICGFSDMYDKQIQCEKCEVWQHFGCMGIEPDTVPDCYLCELCDTSVLRPLRPEQAREVHLRLIPTKQHPGDEASKRKKPQAVRRKKSADDVAALTPMPPGEPDLTMSDKKRPSEPASISRQPSVETTNTSVAKPGNNKEDFGELSRDDRKILQYEQMFKRMEERRDRKERRRRNPEGSSNGSPPRERGSTRERETAGYESHGESTNPPPSPQMLSILDFPPPLPPVIVTCITDLPADSFLPPLDDGRTPVRIIRNKRLIYKDKTMDKEKKARRISTTSDPENSETPTSATPEKPRFSLRLRNIATVKDVQDDSRIELNCVKKRKNEKDGDLSMDEESSNIPISPPLKRRIRTVSFIDNYYSTMADIQTESETQKASRRNRAFSASEEYERNKVEQERSRLYQVYGFKKAVFARFLEDPSCKPGISCQKISSFFGQHHHDGERGGSVRSESAVLTPARVPGALLSSFGPISPLKRCKTVRIMIEESIQKNREQERAYQLGQKITEQWMAPFKVKDPKKRFSKPVNPTASVKSAASLISKTALVTVELHGSTTGKKSNTALPAVSQSIVSTPTTSFLKKAPLPEDTSVRGDGKSEKTELVLKTLAEPKQITPVKELPGNKSVGNVTEVPVVDRIPLSDNFVPIARQDPPLTDVRPKKLSLAEYRQRKLTSQGSSDSLLGISITSPTPSSCNPQIPPASSAPVPELPVLDQAISAGPVAVLPVLVPVALTTIPPVLNTVLEPHPVAVQRSSVIQRTGNITRAPSMLASPVPVRMGSISLGAGRQESRHNERHPVSSSKASEIPRSSSCRVEDGGKSSFGSRPPVENGDIPGKQRFVGSSGNPPLHHQTSLPNGAPYIQTHFRPAPMLASRSKVEDLKT